MCIDTGLTGSVIISILTVTFNVGTIVPNERVRLYFGYQFVSRKTGNGLFNYLRISLQPQCTNVVTTVEQGMIIMLMKLFRDVAADVVQTDVHEDSAVVSRRICSRIIE